MTLDLVIETLNNDNWLSEGVVSFARPGAHELFLRPANLNEPGVAWPTGSLFFADHGLPDIVLFDGLGEFEFFNDWPFSTLPGLWIWPDYMHDAAATITWHTMVVPAPGTLALLGLGALAMRRRR